MVITSKVKMSGILCNYVYYLHLDPHFLSYCSANLENLHAFTKIFLDHGCLLDNMPASLLPKKLLYLRFNEKNTYQTLYSSTGLKVEEEKQYSFNW